MAGSLADTKHFVITGPPGVGKTTLVKSILHELKDKGIRCCGFITEEVRAGGRRIGFDVVTTNGEKGQLARVSDDPASIPSGRQRDYRVGPYSVKLLSFEQTALPTLSHSPSVSDTDDTKHVFVIDEIGKMEMFSQSFKQTVDRLLSNPNNVIVATIPISKGKPIPLVEKIRNHPFSKVYEVSRQNRNSLLEEIMPELYSHILKSRNR